MVRYLVEVKVEAVRHVYVDAGSIEDAEKFGLEKAIADNKGVGGRVLSVYSSPKEFIGGDDEV